VQQLSLGVPKGSLQEATINLFEKSGWRISLSSRNYFPEINDSDMRCSICRAQEMSRYVENGTFDVGAHRQGLGAGERLQREGSSGLAYSKVSQRPARWVLAVPMDSPIHDLADLEGKKIATELVNFYQELFSGQGIRVEVEFSWGATEQRSSPVCATPSWR